MITPRSRRELSKTGLRLLMLAPFPPDLSGDHGGARAIASLVGMLAVKHSVSVLYLREAGGEGIRQPPAGCEQMIGIDAPARRRLGPQRLASKFLAAVGLLIGRRPDWVRQAWSPEIGERIIDIVRDLSPDIVQFEFHVMAQYIKFVRAAAPNARCIITVHEPGHIAAADGKGGRWRKRAGRFVRTLAWTRYERSSLSKADAVVTFTQRDAEAVRKIVGRFPEVTCIPLRTVAAPHFSGGPIESDFIFIGSFRHPPNTDAAVRLATSIFPQIRRARPGARMFIVGPEAPPDVVAAAGDGLEVTGRVDDVRPYLAGASLVLCPLRMGSGMRVKVLEALAFGKAVIASAQAVEGLGLRAGIEFVRADSDQEFVENALALLRDPERRARLGRAAIEWVARTQDLDMWAFEYDCLYERLTKRRDKAA